MTYHFHNSLYDLDLQSRPRRCKKLKLCSQSVNNFSIISVETWHAAGTDESDTYVLVPDNMFKENNLT